MAKFYTELDESLKEFIRAEAGFTSTPRRRTRAASISRPRGLIRSAS